MSAERLLITLGGLGTAAAAAGSAWDAVAWDAVFEEVDVDVEEEDVDVEEEDVLYVWTLDDVSR